MSSRFEFQVDAESEEFCNEIVNEMIKHFGIPESEAIGRINQLWKGHDFEGQDDIRYHEPPEFWAYDIYYGGDSYWWLNPPDLKPKPYKET